MAPPAGLRVTNSKRLDTTVPVPSTISAVKSATMRRGSAPGSVGQTAASRIPARASVGLDGGVQDGVDERVSWCEELGAAGVVGVDAVGLECRAFVASRDWDGRPGALARADCGGHVGDLVAALFSTAHASAQALEGIAEEQFDVVGLKPASPGLVHLAAHHVELVRGQ